MRSAEAEDEADVHRVCLGSPIDLEIACIPTECVMKRAVEIVVLQQFHLYGVKDIQVLIGCTDDPTFGQPEAELTFRSPGNDLRGDADGPEERAAYDKV